MMRARRFDSELIISTQLAALRVGQRVAGHQLARSLNGGERRAHFVRGPVNRLLIARLVGFGFAQLAGAPRSADTSPRPIELSQATATGATYGKHDAVSEKLHRQQVVRRGQQRHDRDVCAPARKQTRRSAPPRSRADRRRPAATVLFAGAESETCRAPWFRTPGRALRRPETFIAVRIHQPVIGGGKRGDAQKHGLAAQSGPDAGRSRARRSSGSCRAAGSESSRGRSVLPRSGDQDAADCHVVRRSSG